MRFLLLITILIFNLNAISVFNNDEQAENSKYVGALKNLLIATQKTRGLTNSYLNGNIEAMLLTHGYRDEMREAIAEMESVPLATDPIIHKRASSISNALIKINRRAFKKDPDVVFDEYTEQIQQILMLAQTVSNRGAKELDPLAKKLLTVMMQTTLPLCEYIGQLRGSGAGIMSKGKITQEQKARILVLMNKIKKLTNKLTTSLKEISSDSKMDEKLSLITKDTSAYLKLAKKELIKSKNIAYDSDDFFEQGTELISLYVDVFEMNNNSILQNSKGWF
ncbi:MAG: nitrate- and nitrite sensing domain-containing protein [Sulfurimonas sp.]|nr:nitrate- and nitrite sensing domain-containing protein [Sulfurimonas sp.]